MPEGDIEPTDRAAPTRPADDTHFFWLDDEGLVLSEGHQEIHALNPAAAFIWTQLTGDQPWGEVTAALAAGLDVTPDVAARHIAALVEEWRERGLLAPGVPVRPERRPDPARDDVLDASAPPARPFVADTERRYRLLGSDLLVRFATAEQREWVEPVIAHLTVEADRAPSAVIDLTAADGVHTVYRDGAPVAQCTAIDRLAPVAKDVLWQTAINDTHYFLYVHAGVVEDDTGCLLLPGPSGSGKSTLTAALSHRAFRYLSDEVALLTVPELRVHAARQALCVKESAWEVLAVYDPAVRTLATHQRLDGKRVRYLPPPPVSAPSTDGVIKHIIFPRYEPGARTELRAVGRVEALRRIMSDCLAAPVPLDAHNVERLVEWIRRIPCHEIVQSSLDEAVDTVRRAWEQRTDG